ncbi:Plant invertase/pectin methylesterase inhibitor superfamily [Perilla frutescens var. hirtella]|uniref:Pectinesterase n=1 Tax=Perilla frutescens var. hirtella TaxID=608512 RepID=A0AAD4JP82_PERFH|nr:Plant invertase/pectin methylesterase inhibitor superfamily [Perilla frutescens var. hirtella]
MAAALLKILLIVIIVCNFASGGCADFGESACLRVPVSEFAKTVNSTVGVVQKVVSTVSKFAGKVGDFRLSNAVIDCLELMDVSMDQLSSALSASQNTNGRSNGTGNVIDDVKALLSGALINQDTCIEGFDGTNNVLLKSLVSVSLDQVTSLVHNLLSMVKANPAAPSNGGGGGSGGRRLITNEEFPQWLKSHDRRILLQAASSATADAVVAADGTGNFTMIGEAIRAAPEYSSKRYVIYIKKGVYNEYLEIHKKKWNIMMIGEGMDATVISGNRSFVDGWTTYRSATFAVRGQGFIARDITFENTAGPGKHQAVSFRSDSDRSVVYRCGIRGYQDTLYAHSMRQFYRECKITGTVDFIFGDGKAVFQNCEIMARKGLPNQKNTITAQGRKDSTEETGFSIQFCNISAEPDVSTPTYLGRPWKLYSRTVIMQSYMSSAVRPEGWLEWNGDYALDSLVYAEYMNYGPGAGLGARVKWPGYHVINSTDEARIYTVAEFIVGNTWLPSTGVRYIAGLTN